MTINLAKGQKIDLTKQSGEELLKFCVGVNWGAIIKIKKTIFGEKKEIEDVDLDLSCIILNSAGKKIDHIYSPEYNGYLKRKKLPLGKLETLDGALIHSGDDTTGDTDGDDGLDNEIISVDLSKISTQAEQIFFFLNIYLKPNQKYDFSNVPYAKIRMYEGTPENVNKVFASYDITTNDTFSGKGALILGKLFKENYKWKFDAIGEPSDDRLFLDTINTILNVYV